jgi:hypothetical protein
LESYLGTNYYIFKKEDIPFERNMAHDSEVLRRDTIEIPSNENYMDVDLKQTERAGLSNRMRTNVRSDWYTSDRLTQVPTFFKNELTDFKII